MKFGSRFLGGLIATVVIITVILCVDKNKTDEFIGTWSYSYEIEYDEAFSVATVINLEFTEDTYRWYIDEEKTEANLKNMYDSYIAYHQVTEELIQAEGYESIANFKQQCIAEDLSGLKEWIESENKHGTWKIDGGTFVFTEDGDATEYYTEYEVDGDILELKTDGITLTKVS